MYKIGDMAGMLWHYLNENGRVQYKKAKEDVLEKSEDLPMKEQRFAMAVGWLAKEDKLSFVEEGTGKRYRLFIELK